jgi:hypothetical protein
MVVSNGKILNLKTKCKNRIEFSKKLNKITFFIQLKFLRVNITYVLRDGKQVKVRGKIGDNVMYLAHRYDIPLEGACEASLACSTCHVYVDQAYLNKIPEPKEE